MTTFNDLNFSPHPVHPSGVRALVFFQNGYGASVIRNSHSYGGADGLFELAVMKGSNNEHVLCYDTPITDDVIGHLTPSQVTDLLVTIANLVKA